MMRSGLLVVLLLLIAVFMMLLSNVLCRRHQHHYHYHHLGNMSMSASSLHSAMHSNQSAAAAAQKVTTFESDKELTESFTPYTKHNTGRHVCSSHRTGTRPVKTTQTFYKPTYKKYMQRCNDNQVCSGVKLVFETAYRDVYNTRSTRQIDYLCCPGWVQVTRTSHGCNKPMCPNPCQNGGTCIRPDTCSCPKEFKGKYCEFDIDECIEQKPCDQICTNVPGSYKCDCRETFVLQPDGQSCRKENEDEPAIEAHDLEYEILDKRLFKLETMLNNVPDQTITKNTIEDINHKMESLTSDIKNLKNRIYDIDNNKRDIRVMKNKISVLESKANKIDDLTKRYENAIKLFYHNKLYN